MSLKPSKSWFVRRTVGWGWRPASWQGWLSAAALVLVTFGAVIALKSSAARLVVILGAAAVYQMVAVVTSGPRTEPQASEDENPQINQDQPASEPAAAPPVPKRRELRLVSPGPGNGSTGSAIEVDRLTKSFGERIAVDSVSFAVGYGEVFGFLGPNGAGKTTTVRMLGTLIAPTSGSAVIAGLPLSATNGVAIRRRIAIMPETPGLYQRLTVAENLEFFAGLYGAGDGSSRIPQALDAVGLQERANDSCGSLSKGLRQRVALARALLNDPRVLFLDEPTSGLDPVAVREVHTLIDGLRDQGVTIFLTTHRLEEAERLCDRVAILNTKLRTIGRPDELEQRLFHKSLLVQTAVPLKEPERVFSGLPAVESWRADAPGGYVLEVSDPVAAASAASRALVEAGADIVSIGESRHSLEDVYLELIEDDVEAVRS
jgi:ABC-2 type transport system ATP-binding protein